ncbi:hypothetical protein AVEN_231071-1 [Araneus ventricosus]|uniref:Uncharacterized protein n=1 Tax=Araneus ventricosus TaxID=182803 RepID=A0A4Y2A5I3_ARAVE|nr:hypothetical protein AVEN_231071-1 [Araneus ventricosus]
MRKDNRAFQHEGNFRTDLVILNRGRMTRTTPERSPTLQTSAPHQRDDVWFPTYDLAYSRSNTIGFRAWNPPVPDRHLTTKPSWPHVCKEGKP